MENQESALTSDTFLEMRDCMADWLMWGIVILFAALSILFICGKGSFLIAGYNTASAKEKARYDEKKMCQITGIGMAIITLFLIIMILFKEKAPGVAVSLMLLGTIAVVIVCLALSNIICVRKNAEITPEMLSESKEEIQKQEEINRKVSIGIGITMVVIFAIVGVLLSTGDVKVVLNENSMEIDASYVGDKVLDYSEIKEVSFEDNFQFGSRVGGWGSFKLNEGRFKNTEFGRYTLYAYIKCRSVVVMQTEEDTIVVNAESREKTEKLYLQILERIEEKNF